MANTRELRRRIKSVKSTAQITRAMEMVAATKMRRAQSQALNSRPYDVNLNAALVRLLPVTDTTAHPLLQANKSEATGIILLSTDKSLCGALNTNLFRFLSSSGLLVEGNVFYTLGKKGRNFIAKSGKNLQADFENLDQVGYRQACLFAKLVIDAFSAEQINQVFIVYPHFGSTLRQEPAKVKLLPVELDLTQTSRSGYLPEYLIEPSLNTLLDFLLNHYVRIKIYQSMLEAKASEHSARMIAMQNATDNALELVEDLNLTYNQTRQEGITKELLEITTAAMAMG